MDYTALTHPQSGRPYLIGHRLLCCEEARRIVYPTDDYHVSNLRITYRLAYDLSVESIQAARNAFAAREWQPGPNVDHVPVSQVALGSTNQRASSGV